MNEPLAIYLSFYSTFIEFVRPAIVATIVIGLWIALRRTRLASDAQLSTWLAVAIPLAAWFATIWSIALTGALRAQAGVLSFLPFALVLPIAIGLVSIMRSERIAAALDTVSPETKAFHRLRSYRLGRCPHAIGADGGWFGGFR